MWLSVWWSFYVEARGLRRLRRGPIRGLERAIGHSFAVLDIRRDERLRNVFLIEVWARMHTSKPDMDAAYDEVLQYVATIVERLAGYPVQPLHHNRCPTEDACEMFAFYWDRTTAVSDVASSGVLILLSEDPALELQQPLREYPIAEMWRLGDYIEYRRMLRNMPIIDIG